MKMKILHFADAHIDMARFGRHDPETGLPMRVVDFLKSLDVIIDAAINEKVDMVIFAGDAYRDRTPAPTFQREWGKRMMRLSCAKIPTLLVVGNHDLSPATGRANALQEYETLEVPYIRVINKPCLLTSKELFGLPIQIIGIPWITQSGLIANQLTELKNINEELGSRLTELLKNFIEQLDPGLPTILTAHASVQGAIYGNERGVMLGKDLILPKQIICDPRLDYVALGHIHKFQDLNENSYPPVIYPGSIERVDFGEVNDDKYFVISNIEKNATKYELRKLTGRNFFDRKLELTSPENIKNKLEQILPTQKEMKDAIGRLTITYPREWESFIDEQALRQYVKDAFEFHLVKHPQSKIGNKVSTEISLLNKTPQDQLDFYWKNLGLTEAEIKELKPLAEEIMASINNNGSNKTEKLL
jgi:exonuclease SbcD